MAHTYDVPPLEVVGQEAAEGYSTSREFWKEYRKKLLRTGPKPSDRRYGGSSLSKMMNIGGSGANIYALYDEIMNEMNDIPEPPPNEAMLIGINKEDTARRLYELVSGPIDIVPTRAWGPKFIVSPDGIRHRIQGRAHARSFDPVPIDGQHNRVIIEFKIPFWQKASAIDQWTEPPLKYRAQLELYCRAYDCNEAELVVFLYNEDENTKRFADSDPLWHESLAATESGREAIKRLFRVFRYHRNDVFWQYILDTVVVMDRILESGVKPKPSTEGVVPVSKAKARVENCFLPVQPQ